MLSSTNRNILRDKMPSDYIKDIIDGYGGGEAGFNKLTSVLTNHCITKKGVEYLLVDDYFGFISERRKAIVEQFRTNCHVRNIIEAQIEEVEDDIDIEEFALEV